MQTSAGCPWEPRPWGAGLDPRAAWCPMRGCSPPALVQMPGKSPSWRNHLPCMLLHTILPEPSAFSGQGLRYLAGYFLNLWSHPLVLGTSTLEK